MRKNRILISLLIMGMVISLTGCFDTTMNDSKGIEQGDTPGLVAAATYPEGVGFDDYDGNRAVRDNNPVSVDYLKALKNFSGRSTFELFKEQERATNIMYSPVSLYMALALSTSGANHETQGELLSVLNMEDLGVAQLEKQTSNLFRLLYRDNEIGKLQLANSLWLDKEVVFKERYVDTASNDYYASVFSVDFSTKEAGDAIAQWISQNSKGTLEGRNPVNPEQIATIISTIYFYDEWVNKFNEKKTEKDTFYAYNGDTVQCDFMNMEFGSHGFIDGEGYTAASLGFKNHGAMNFYLPDEGVDVYDLISSEEKAKALLDKDNSTKAHKYGEVVFQVPKFGFDSTLHLKELLNNMGVESAFKEDADFTNLTTESIAYIDDITQSTHISIDEKGCEASAFTQINYVGSGPPQDNAEMILNRPFIFTITSPNDVILFIGVINNPLI